SRGHSRTECAQAACVVGEPRPDVPDDAFCADLPGIPSGFLRGPARTQLTETDSDKDSAVTGIARIVFDGQCHRPARSRGEENFDVAFRVGYRYRRCHDT